MKGIFQLIVKMREFEPRWTAQPSSSNSNNEKFRIFASVHLCFHQAYFQYPRHRTFAPDEKRILLGSEALDHAECMSKDVVLTSLVSAWAMDRRRSNWRIWTWRTWRLKPKEYRRKVDAATRCSGVCPHTWPSDLNLRRLSHWWCRWNQDVGCLTRGPIAEIPPTDYKDTGKNSNHTFHSR